MQKLLVFGDNIWICMADIEVSDPDVYRKTAPVDSRGRVSIGRDLAGESVTIVVEVNE